LIIVEPKTIAYSIPLLIATFLCWITLNYHMGRSKNDRIKNSIPLTIFLILFAFIIYINLPIFPVATIYRDPMPHLGHETYPISYHSIIYISYNKNIIWDAYSIYDLSYFQYYQVSYFNPQFLIASYFIVVIIIFFISRNKSSKATSLSTVMYTRRM
jgi:hypothetical protein